MADWVARGDRGASVYDDVAALDRALALAVERRWALGRSARARSGGASHDGVPARERGGRRAPGARGRRLRRAPRRAALRRRHLGGGGSARARPRSRSTRSASTACTSSCGRSRRTSSSTRAATISRRRCPCAACRRLHGDRDPRGGRALSRAARRRSLDGHLPRPAPEPPPRARALARRARAQPLLVHVRVQRRGRARRRGAHRERRRLGRSRSSAVARTSRLQGSRSARDRARRTRSSPRTSSRGSRRAATKKERFDLVIVDPPSYSSTKKRRFVAESDYDDLVALAAKVLAPRREDRCMLQPSRARPREAAPLRGRRACTAGEARARAAEGSPGRVRFPAAARARAAHEERACDACAED